MYKIPCGNCEMTYTGETGRKFGTRLKEHKTEVKATTSKLFTRSRCLSTLKGKVFPYSLPSVGPGADPGVQAVSPQVT